jgi:hypothetical protein
VLHTWGQDLHYHPHLHVVATGGGLACTATGTVTTPSRWVACRPGFFLPVRVLSRVFRGKYLALLRQAQAAGELSWHGELAGLAEPAAFATWLQEQYQSDWVVYAKPPFGGPEQVLKYLARYTHRVALSNRRLLSLDEEQVAFTAKDYAAGGEAASGPAGGGGVPQALGRARAAFGVREDPALRPVGEPGSHGAVDPVPGVVGVVDGGAGGKRWVGAGGRG